MRIRGGTRREGGGGEAQRHRRQQRGHAPLPTSLGNALHSHATQQTGPRTEGVRQEVKGE